MQSEGEKVQVGKDQAKAQSEKDSYSKNRGGKKPNLQSGKCHENMKTFRKPNEQDMKTEVNAICCISMQRVFKNKYNTF